MERWGVFSVIDHKDDIRLAMELLLYDRIVVPTPMDRDGPDWERWVKQDWDPDKLIKTVDQLKKTGNVFEAEWDLDRQKEWKQAFEEAKADIEKINDQTKREMAERDAAYAATRSVQIKHLKGELPIHYGVVEFYAAYQTKADFESIHPSEDAVREGIERVNFLIKHQLAIPDVAPKKLIDSVIKITTTQKFRDRRLLFYDWQRNLVEQRCEPKRIMVEMDQLVRDFNKAALSYKSKCRMETVITVLAVVAAVGSGAVAALHLPAFATSGIAAGTAIWRRFLGRSEPDATHRIAAPGAMFHQIEADTGFEFRVSKRPKDVQ